MKIKRNITTAIGGVAIIVLLSLCVVALRSRSGEAASNTPQQDLPPVALDRSQAQTALKSLATKALSNDLAERVRAGNITESDYIAAVELAKDCVITAVNEYANSVGAEVKAETRLKWTSDRYSYNFSTRFSGDLGRLPSDAMDRFGKVTDNCRNLHSTDVIERAFQIERLQDLGFVEAASRDFVACAHAPEGSDPRSLLAARATKGGGTEDPAEVIDGCLAAYPSISSSPLSQ